MDARLFRIGNLRPRSLTFEDLPELAKALVAKIRGKARLSTGFLKDVYFVRLNGLGINFLIRGEDWEKIRPYILDGTFDPSMVPVKNEKFLDKTVQFDPELIDLNDVDLYNRVLRVLNTLFSSRRYPHSNF